MCLRSREREREREIANGRWFLLAHLRTYMMIEMECCVEVRKLSDI